MREELHYDGVRLAPFSPIAWTLTAGLTVLVHRLAETGVGLASAQLQSTMLVTIFFGVLAVLGTLQKLNHLRERGRRIPATALMTLFLVFAATVTYWGVSTYV